MATKTFEELKQMAIQIRDEKTNKQNTATRIGTQMLEHLNKLEQEYYNKENIDEQNKQTDVKFSELASKMNYFFSIPISFFSSSSLNITSFAFLYIQQSSETEKYKRYIIKKGNYNYPTAINTALVVSIDNSDSAGLLVSEVPLGNVTNNMFVIGYTDSLGDFKTNGNSDFDINILKGKINGLLQPYFSLLNVNVTKTEISFQKFSFLFLRGALEGKYYQRYIIKEGTYSLPNSANKALVVSLKNKDESGNLIPFITDSEISAYVDAYYIIGLCDSTGNFKLCDTSSVYNILTRNITSVQQDLSNLQNQINSISNLFIDSKFSIPSDILKKNKATLLEDGSLTNQNEDYLRVSDFIEIKGSIKRVKTCFNITSNEGKNVGLAFYSDRNEESFISVFKEYTEELVYGWVKYDGNVVAPDGAKYIRLAGNTTLYNESPGIDMYELQIKDENVYSDAPSEYYEYFSYDVDTAKEDIEDNTQSTVIIDSAYISKDNAFIRLPFSYDKKGKPTRLIILNHGAGGRVTDNSTENGNTSFALLLQKKGYAVLCINGVPENMRNTDYMNVAQNGAATHMGGWVYMRSAIAAYNYVTKKYNIAKDGCFVIGRSMGGLTSLNLAMSGIIPVKALALDAPVIDSFHDAYFSGGWSGGTLGGSTPAIFAWIQQWDYCNFEDNTYVIPVNTYIIHGVTYVVTEEIAKPLANLKSSSQDMAILWYLNRNKQSGYNAYKTGDFLIKNLDEEHVYNTTTDNDDEYFGKKLPCPCKIWFGSGDTVNQIPIAERFVQKCRNGGSIVIMRTAPTTRHCVWSETSTMPDGVDISVIEDGITCSPYAVELWNWIKRWDDNV